MIVTLDTIKKMLQIENTDSDVAISLMIPYVESYIKEYTHNEFTDGYPLALQIIAVRIIRDNLNKSGLMNDALGLNILPEVDVLLKRYRRVKWV